MWGFLVGWLFHFHWCHFIFFSSMMGPASWYFLEDRRCLRIDDYFRADFFFFSRILSFHYWWLMTIFIWLFLFHYFTPFSFIIFESFHWCVSSMADGFDAEFISFFRCFDYFFHYAMLSFFLDISFSFISHYASIADDDYHFDMWLHFDEDIFFAISRGPRWGRGSHFYYFDYFT